MLFSLVKCLRFRLVRYELFWSLCQFLIFGRLVAWADPSVTLTWNPSTDPDTVGYRVYFGGASGVYTNTIEVGDTTNVTICGLAAGDTYYFTATTLTSSGAESAFCNEATYVIPEATTNSPGTTNAPAGESLPPTLNPIANLTIEENAGLQTVNLTGIGSGSAGSNAVIVSAVSSNPSLIPAPTVNYSCPDTTGTLTFMPAAAASGSATVTVTVDNGEATNNLISEAFTVTISPAPVANPMPTLDGLTNLTLYENAGTQTVALTGISSGITSGYQWISVWAYSSDSSILPNPAVNYTSPDDTGTLTLAPVTNALGTAVVQVKVNNGVADVSQTFTVTVVPPPANALPPTCNAVKNVTLRQNSGPQTVALTGIGAGSGNPNDLVISALSSNPALVPAPSVSYSAPNSTGTLTFAPMITGCGTATMTIILSNFVDHCAVSHSFSVNVIPMAVPAQPPSLATGTASATADSVANSGLTSAQPAIAAATLVPLAGANRVFSFQVAGLAGGTYVVQASTDLAHWTSVQTNTAPFAFQESAAGMPRRFYRASYQPPVAQPALSGRRLP